MVMKVNLGCGQKPLEGFINVDKAALPNVDVVHDLFTFPWPWEDNSVDEVYCIHFLEHVPAKIRPRFMDELYRIMKVGGVASFIVPAYNSQRYYQDFTHEWPPIVPASFQYFNKDWREGEGLTHGDYEMTCDFDFNVGSNIVNDWKHRQMEAQQFGAEHYWNIATDLIVNMTKKG